MCSFWFPGVGLVGWVVLFTAYVNLMYVGRPAVMVSAILELGIGLLYWLLHHYLYCFFLCTINFFFFFFFFT